MEALGKEIACALGWCKCDMCIRLAKLGKSICLPVQSGSDLLVVLASVAIFVLAGCKIDGTVEVHKNGDTNEVITFEDTDDMMRKARRTCEDLRVYLRGVVNFALDARMEDVTSPGGHLRCKLSSDAPFGTRNKLVDNGQTYTFTIPPTKANEGEEYESVSLRLTFTMPGKVVKSSLGKIEGRKVVIDGFDILDKGVTITSLKKAAVSMPNDVRSSLSSERSGSISSGKKDDAFPVWGYIAVGVASLLVVVGIAVFVKRKIV